MGLTAAFSPQLSDLQQQGASEKSRLEQRVWELESSLEQQPSPDVAAEVSSPSRRVLRATVVRVTGSVCVCVCVCWQVKRVMNGVFRSLRGEFDVGESYNGQAVLSIIVTTIKVSRSPRQPLVAGLSGSAQLCLLCLERHPAAAQQHRGSSAGAGAGAGAGGGEERRERGSPQWRERRGPESSRGTSLSPS